MRFYHFLALFSTMWLPVGAIASKQMGWEECVQERYAKKEDEFRNYSETTPDHVKAFYLDNHSLQTLALVLKKKEQFTKLDRKKMTIWEAIEQLDQVVDESDPDLGLPQSYHAYQTAEALRKDGHPRWLIATGFIHDLGKMLALYDEPQWAVVGDTFPVGCAFADQVVFKEFFMFNPDSNHPVYQTQYGIYSPGCGFDHLHMAWGHDEYLYHVVKNFLPEAGSYVIRYHSFYAAHREGAYDYFMNEKDRAMLPWLKLFSQYDLYSKSSETLNLELLKPYYRDLMAEFFPEPLAW